jgi:WD40 repeat protein
MNALTLIISLSAFAIIGMGIMQAQPSGSEESINFSLNKEIKEGYGHSICFHENGDFVACNSGIAHLFEGEKLKSSTQIYSFWSGEPTISDDGQTCFAGLNKVNLNTGKSEYLDLKTQFEKGLESGPERGHFEVRYSCWAPDARDVAVFINFRNPRGIGVTSDYSGPRTRLLLLDGKTLKVRHVLRHDAGFSDRQAVTISKDHIAAADNVVRIWERETGKILHKITTDNAYCPSLCFDASGQYLAVGRVGGSIEVYEVKSGERLFVREKLHSGRPMALAFHPDGNWLMSGGEDQVIFATHWKNADQASIKLPVDDKVEGIAFSPVDKNLMYVSAKFQDERILIYEVCID